MKFKESVEHYTIKDLINFVKYVKYFVKQFSEYFDEDDEQLEYV